MPPLHPAALVFPLFLAATPLHPGAAQAGTQDDLLARQLAEVERVTERYRDVEAARRDGYRRPAFGMDAPLMGEHWVNRELLAAEVDLARPAVLQYIRDGERRVLVGVTYGRWQRPGAPLPEGFAGDGDRWHTHDLESLVRRLGERRPAVVRWAVRRTLDAGRWRGPDGRTELAMLHVWLWSENPDGVFANHNPALPYLRTGLPAAWARAGDHAAARGIELLRPGYCETAIPRLSRALDGGDDQWSTLREACAGAAERLAAARAGGLAGDSLNDAAAEAWQRLTRSVYAALTPEQQARAEILRRAATGDEHHEH